MRFLISGENTIDTDRAGRLATYAIKGVELMDPNVGGDTSIKVLTQDDGEIQIEPYPDEKKPDNPKEEVENVLMEIDNGLENLVVDN